MPFSCCPGTARESRRNFQKMNLKKKSVVSCPISFLSWLPRAGDKQRACPAERLGEGCRAAAGGGPMPCRAKPCCAMGLGSGWEPAQSAGQEATHYK